MTTEINTESVQAWHFTRADGTTDYLQQPETVGKLYTLDGDVRCCRHGYHGSVLPVDALHYAPGTWVGLRELSGKRDAQSDKLCASQCRLLTPRIDAKNTILLFASDCAERVLPLFETQYPDDKRPRQAIEALRGYVAGTITIKQVTAAANAANAAANAAYAAANAAYAAANAANAAANAANGDEEAAWQNAELDRRLRELLNIPGKGEQE